MARVTLARPDVRNAFNAEVIRELSAVFLTVSEDPTVRAVVLAGEGKSFCGGADVNWMRGALDLSYDENVADAQAMSDMFRAIDRCSKPVIGRIHGAALGGGAGLAAVCDIAISADDTTFGFTEVKLGIIPAVISPFVIAKIGTSHARALFLTGERFTAKHALEIGLVHRGRRRRRSRRNSRARHARTAQLRTKRGCGSQDLDRACERGKLRRHARHHGRRDRQATYKRGRARGAARVSRTPTRDLRCG